MDARFKHVQGPSGKAPLARVAQDSTTRSSSPAISRISRLPPSRMEPSSALSPPRAIGSPRPSIALSATPGRSIPGPSRLGTRPVSVTQPPPSPSPSLRPPSRSAQPVVQVDDEFSTSNPSSHMPPPSAFQSSSLRAPTRMRLNGHVSGQPPRPQTVDTIQPSYHTEDTSEVIRSILANDPRRSVEGLKKVQKLFELDEFVGSVDEILTALIKQSKVVFNTPNRLQDPAWFRVSKHLIQAINFFCDRPILLKELDNDLAEDLLYELTARLLQTDDSTGGKCLIFDSVEI